MIKIARIRMKCIDPGQRRRTSFHEGGAGLRSVRLALEDAAVRGLVARRLFTQNYTRHRIGPERCPCSKLHTACKSVSPVNIVAAVKRGGQHFRDVPPSMWRTCMSRPLGRVQVKLNKSLESG